MKKLLLATALLAVLPLAAQAEEEKVLNLYNWTEYMPKDVLKSFTKETGIKVKESNYAATEEMYSKLKAGGGGYDLVVPSTYFVQRMAREGLLEPLDHAKLPNLKNIDPKYLDKPFDPGNQYSVPYLMSSVGIVVDGGKVDVTGLKSWLDLWKPEFKGKVLLMDTARETFAVVQKALGYSANDTDPKHIEAAFNKLKELVPSVKLFNGESPKVSFIQGEVSVGVAWNGEAFMGSQEKKTLTYVYPQEGIVLAMDTMAIPKGAKHPENAHKFLDYIMRPEIAAKISEALGYGTLNAEAIKLLPKKLASNRIVYPTDDDLKNSELLQDIPTETQGLYEKYWSELKVGKKVKEAK